VSFPRDSPSLVNRWLIASLLIGTLTLPACGGRAAAPDVAAPIVSAPTSSVSAPPTDTFTIGNRWPHDRAAYTEGLVYDQGRLFESTGLNGASTLREVDLQTGQVIASLAIGPELFAEGLTLFNGKLIQLTWQSHTGFVYDLGCFCLERTFAYDGEGWGLTHDDQYLIMSDGTARIRYLDPQTFAVVKTIDVSDRGQPITNLNELEYIHGEIFANVWLTDQIARIDPASGAIIGWVNLTGLLPDADRNPPANELNGVAYDAAADRIFVTGKNWPELFQIALVGE
jgi:glutamine cyclotransferase